MVGQPGHSVIIAEDRFQRPGEAERAIGDYIRQMRAEAQAGGIEPTTMMGGWHDTANREIVLDHVDVVSRAEAVRLGRERGEQAVFDLDAGEEIPTGGTGGREMIEVLRSLADGNGSLPPVRTGPDNGLGEPDRRRDRADGEQPGEPRADPVGAGAPPA